MHQSLISQMCKFARDRNGTVAIQVGLMLTVLIGMVSLGTEIPIVLNKHRQLQSVADMAAVSAAASRVDPNNLVAQTEARAIAAAAGLVHGKDGVTVQLTRPYAGDANALEVVINQPLSLVLAKLLGVFDFNMRARAVARQSHPGIYCILALDLGAAASVDIKNDAILPSTDCGVASNSASNTALVLGSSSVVKANTTVRGRISRAANAVLAGATNTENGPNIDDPYASVPAAPPLGCKVLAPPPPPSTPVVLTGGRYCSWPFDANLFITLKAGTYVLDAPFKLANGATVDAKDVTLIINDKISLGDGAKLSIIAQTTSAYAGLAIYSPRSAAAATIQTFGKTVTLDIQGALYFPNQILELKRNPSVSAASGCTQAIARLVRVENSVLMGKNCAGTGTRAVTGVTSYLVQ